MRFLAAAIKQLRTNNAPLPGAGRATRYLYRSFKGLSPSDGFMENGGSELGTMSTTTELEVAMRYAASESPMLLRLAIENFLQYGADIAFLSAFPGESEVVYPPLTFMLPSPHGRREIEGIVVVDATVTVA